MHNVNFPCNPRSQPRELYTIKPVFQCLAGKLLLNL